MNQLNLNQAMAAARTMPELPPSQAAEETPAAGLVALSSSWPVWLLAGAVVAASAIIWADAPGSRDCQIPAVPLAFGANTEISVSMRADVPCTIAVQPGPAIRRLTLQSKPEHGTVTARGRTGVIYRPNATFRGEDRFTFSLAGGSTGAEETATIQVQAIVK
jgi:hypothetical protein